MSTLHRAILALEKAEAKIAALERARSEPIAIVGLGCRFPGGRDPESFWRALEQGVDGIREIPESRWRVDPSLQGGRWAALLDEVEGFDAAFFDISPREAAGIDPQHRLLLEVSCEALEDAGVPLGSLGGTSTGVFTGIMTQDYQHLTMETAPEKLDIYATTGVGACFGSGRLSYVLGLQGPCMSIDTACSSSLAAMHLACQSLRSEESDVALAGGVNLILSPWTMQLVVKTQGLSPDGRCRAFDARANGFVRGEGCGVVVLKRLSDALRDKDRIRAVIRGSAVNQDGRSTGLTAPNVLSQQALLRKALEVAGVKPEEVGYVEAHGTGTPLGDPIELEALREVLGAPRADGSTCLLGSVKTNLGHLEAAAGVVGLIKTVLALEHESIPRHLNFEALNPRISLEGTALRVTSAAQPWKRGSRPRVAGVSSFGLSGTNAHVVLEEAPLREEEGREEGGEHVVVVSARSEAALRAVAGSYAGYLRGEGAACLGDVAHTAAVRRSHHEHRLAVVGSSREEVAAALEGWREGRAGKGVAQGRAGEGGARVVFVYSGQGAQWKGMGLELMERSEVFRRALEECEGAFAAVSGGWSLKEALKGEAVERADTIQTTLFAMQVGLTAQWRAWGVEPEAVVGHSMGELAGAYAAGALTLEEAAGVIWKRSQQMRTMSGRGATAVVELGWEQVKEALKGYEERVSLAAINSGRTTAIAGETGAVEELLAGWEKQQVFCRRVRMDVASHSPQMEALGEPLMRALEGLRPKAGAVPIYSTVLGERVDGSGFGPEYWVRNMRQPVLFAKALQGAVGSGPCVVVEVSAHPVLLPAIEQVLKESGAAERGVAVASLRREQPERRTLLEGLGAVHARGGRVDWSKGPEAKGRCVALPTYAWQRERHWLERPASPAGAGLMREAGGHPLAGAEFTVSTQAGVRFWETVLSVSRVGYLKDHRVGDAVVLPGTAYVEMGLWAGAEAFGKEGGFELEQVRFREALVLGEGEGRRVQMALTEEGPGEGSFRVSSQAQGEAHWTLHASGRVKRVPEEQRPAEALEAIRARLGESRPADGYYEELDGQGLKYGPAFRGVRELWSGAGEALGRLEVEPGMARDRTYRLHPAVLDAALQVVGGATSPAGGEAGPELPVLLSRVRVHGEVSARMWSHVRVGKGPEGEREADIELLDEAGRLVAEVRGLRTAPLGGGKAQGDGLPLLVQGWRRLESAAEVPSKSGRWLVVLDEGGWGEAVAEQLEARAQQVWRWAPGRDGAALEHVEKALERAFRDEDGRGVVVCHALDAVVEESSDAAQVLAAQEGACVGVLSLVRAMGRRRWRKAPRLWLVTRVAQRVEPDDGPVALGQVALWGLGRTIAVERPELSCTRVDVGPGSAAEELVLQLVAEPLEEEIVLRPGGVYAGRLEKASAPPGTERRESAGQQPFRVELQASGNEGRILARLLQEAARAFDTGGLKPLPGQALPASRMAEALRALAQGRRVGRLVVDLTEPEVRLPVGEGVGGLKPESSYLVTGGLGGLGLSVAQWMVEQGARRLVLVGRTGAEAEEQRRRVEALRAGGAQVEVCRADVGNQEELGRAVARAEELGPLAGVVHAAGLLDDALLEQQGPERLRKVMRPKVAGAWNLHRLTREKALDFFVLYSSAASLLGSPGQGNYAAANAFLDGLAEYRRTRGLPALSIQWGAFSEVGMAAAQANRGARLAQRGMESLTPQQGWRALGELLRSTAAQVGVVPLNARQWVEFYPHLATMARFKDLLQSGTGQPKGERELMARLRMASAAERPGMMEALVREQVAEVLKLEPSRIEKETPLKALGIDSLMGLELRNRLEAKLGITLSATLAWTYPNVAALTGHLCATLDGAPGEARQARPEPLRGEAAAVEGSALRTGERKQDIERALDEMSDDELASMGEQLLGSAPSTGEI